MSNNQVKKETLDEYDKQKLIEARCIINAVFEYNYKPSGVLSNKLNTLLNKIDKILDTHTK